MKAKTLALCLLLALPYVNPAAGKEEPIDFDRARQLFEKRQRGEELTADERAYVQRAIAERQKGQGGQPAQGRPPAPAKWTGHLTPLTELGTAKYKGEDGGLYGGGRNEPPKIHLDAALKESAKVQPLDANGKPSKSGKVGLLSVGMSNTTMEYSRFKQLADADAAKSPSVVIVDGAQGGQTGRVWANAEARVWGVVDERMKQSGITDQQVQVVWIKQAEAGPSQYGDFPKHATVLKDNLVKCLNLLKKKFPNLRMAYLSSRIYAGYATTGLNPEPFSYESAFSMRWLIQDQIAGKPGLNYDPARGEVTSPLLLWGPYLWADGTTPRKSDGLIWETTDLSDRDGTHPSTTGGREKVAQLLLKFLKTDPTAKTWFVRNASTATAQ